MGIGQRNTGMEARSRSGRHEEGEGKIKETLRWRNRAEDKPVEEEKHTTVEHHFVETGGTCGHC